jgi:hypothetical protein
MIAKRSPPSSPICHPASGHHGADALGCKPYIIDNIRAESSGASKHQKEATKLPRVAWKLTSRT